MTESPRRCRLTARAQIDGALREPGYVFTLMPGQRGPHRTVRASDYGAAIADPHQQALKDEPLYVLIDEPALGPEGASNG